ncbi:uncharacterized protein [Eurosta solidaginis]|uniref:uncharacterized protein isoform X1 n=1 Tax=Eurosta solidaginis TaxID=178769 RepID=UPI0035315111
MSKEVKCFACDRVFIELSILLKHFKDAHGLTHNSDFRCTFSNCNQLFSNLYCFKRHTQNHLKHFIESELTLPESKRTKIDLPFVNDSSRIVAQIADSDRPCNNTDEMKESKLNVSKKCQSFLLDLHTKSNISRKDVLSIQESASAIMSSVVEPLKNKLLSYTPENERQYIIEFVNFCENPFKDVQTEYKFLKSVERSDEFSKPQFFIINNEMCEVILNNRPTIEAGNVFGCIMPIKFQIRKFFELTSVLEIILNNINYLFNSSSITHFINSASFKEKLKFFVGKTVLPFFVYMDSFEINNPLGSHANADQICGVYYIFPTLPQYLLSNLNYIFVAAYFKSKEHKKFGNEPFMKPLIDIFKSLEEDGLELNLKNCTKKIYFVFCNIIGDNLGLNDILGFTTSFNSNYYCRFCMRSKAEMHLDCVEYTDFIRSEKNYNAALVTNDVKLTGIKLNCLFNDLTFFVLQQFLR